MPQSIRQACLWIHRYTGLAIMAFLIMAGITGALLSFHHELDDVFNQHLAKVTPVEAPMLPIAALHDTVISAYPEFGFSSLPMTVAADRAAVFTVDRVRGGAKKPQPSFQEVYVNPYTAEIIGTRNKDEWAWRNTMWKVFWLHRDLLLGDIGRLLLGIVALIWTINCLIGFYLTLPRAVNKRPVNNAHVNNRRINSKESVAIEPGKKPASMIKRWLPAWKVRTKTNAFKLNYDLHRALGLWLWVMLFAIAWSSVGFNLSSVYQPVMQSAVGFETWQQQSKRRAKDNNAKDNVRLIKLGLDQDNIAKVGTTSLTTAQDNRYVVTKGNSIDYLTKQAHQAAKDKGLEVQQLLGMRWVEEQSQWQLRFKTNRDVGVISGASSITVDAQTGKVVRVNFGYQAGFGNKADQWLSSLHMGHIGYGIGHLLYQIWLSLVGLVVVILAISGFYLWLKTRSRTHKSR